MLEEYVRNKQALGYPLILETCPSCKDLYMNRDHLENCSKYQQDKNDGKALEKLTSPRTVGKKDSIILKALLKNKSKEEIEELLG
jgi:hypothetical protein